MLSGCYADSCGNDEKSCSHGGQRGRGKVWQENPFRSLVLEHGARFINVTAREEEEEEEEDAAGEDAARVEHLLLSAPELGGKIVKHHLLRTNLGVKGANNPEQWGRAEEGAISSAGLLKCS